MAATIPIDSPQMQQWSFEKPALADSSVDAATAEPSPTLSKGTIALQERYMSSEENLSPVGEDSGSDSSDSEYDYDEEAVIHEAKECHSARKLSMCDIAMSVSYVVFRGAKIVEMAPASPLERPILQQRSASLAHLPILAVPKLQADITQRMSLGVTPKSTRPISPLASAEPRRPSTSYSPISKKSSLLDLGESSSNASLQTAPTSRSASLVSEPPVRSVSAAPDVPASGRSSVYMPTGSRPALQRIQTTQSHFRHSHMPTPSPMSPGPHAFLNTDPFESSTNITNSASVKPSSSHRRLRSISMKLSLARIAITPSNKKNDSRTSKGQSIPASPYTPSTPQTAPLEGTSGFMSPMPNKLRRASTILRPKSRGSESARGPSPDMAPPPVPVLNRASTMQSFRHSRMVARGANEREPTLVIPPCPEAEFNQMTNKKLRKRKSLMDLL
jgi:hypothetical protein